MKTKSILLMILTIFFAFSFSTSAQEEESRDILEVLFKGGLAIPDGGITNWNNDVNAKTGWNVGLDIGYFLNENVVFGFRFMYQQMNINTDMLIDNSLQNSRHRLYSPNLYIKYIKITDSRWEPFVSGHLGVENAKFTSEVVNDKQNRYRALSYGPALSYGLTAGMFYWNSDYSGLFIEGTFHGASTNSSTASYIGNDYSFDTNLRTFDINIGIRFLFSSGD